METYTFVRIDENHFEMIYDRPGVMHKTYIITREDMLDRVRQLNSEGIFVTIKF